MIEIEDIPITKEEYIAMAKTINQLRKEKQHLIDKACEWLYQRQAVDLQVPNIEKFIDDFIKAMEEQK